jgi:alpha-methylacyl-CoA racemase
VVLVTTGGPLAGVRVVELAGIGPGPFAGMLLADLGAEVIQVDRTVGSASQTAHERDHVQRGRRSIRLDLKDGDGVALLFRLVERSDVLVDPYRPGVAERLGIGPEVCLERNPRLVYARMTGWGQDGPLASHAGHDINYLAISGALEGMGRAGQPPTPALNYVADLGGGALYLVVGVLAALFERHTSGRGQVVDAAMVDGVASMTAFVRGIRASGQWPGGRGENSFDSGAPWYDTYATSDRRWVAIGCLEPQFYATLLEVLGLRDDPVVGVQDDDRARWPAMKARFAEVLAGRTRDEWAAMAAERPDLCLSPVLELDEAPAHPHNVARTAFLPLGADSQPAPAPRLSRTPGTVGRAPVALGADTDEVLAELGCGAEEIADLRRRGSVS